MRSRGRGAGGCWEGSFGVGRSCSMGKEGAVAFVDADAVLISC